MIGRALGADLAHDGHEVIILSRDPDRTKAMPEGTRMVGWNARDEEVWGDLADGAYAIINLAGENISENRWTEGYKARILESRVNVGTAVVKALKRAKKRPPVLIQASGIVLSTEGGVLIRMLKVYKKFIGGPLGNGSQWFPCIHIIDEVRAIRFLVDDKKMSGHFNLVAPYPLRNVDFSKALGRAIGTSSFLSVPVFAFRVWFSFFF